MGFAVCYVETAATRRPGHGALPEPLHTLHGRGEGGAGRCGGGDGPPGGATWIGRQRSPPSPPHSSVSSLLPSYNPAHYTYVVLGGRVDWVRKRSPFHTWRNGVDIRFGPPAMPLRTQCMTTQNAALDCWQQRRSAGPTRRVQPPPNVGFHPVELVSLRFRSRANAPLPQCCEVDLAVAATWDRIGRTVSHVRFAADERRGTCSGQCRKTLYSPRMHTGSREAGNGAVACQHRMLVSIISLFGQLSEQEQVMSHNQLRP
ncbi:uncharacterized protein LY79DRAFT_143587 [Colletotrichum navitas]|uniref:Uncharacterized protein n=1 Tax=Colletotrichum navitas TaxID=681940 RepID=A0AAD8QBJ9_9PEZI|nr:uncharacterized protein LY79DRAFT_143587 [Colletotrichum navitas]KAK1599536.1 hypothetical protein LY79DRAFT_143587 [Colletotrichum navitas]